MSRSHLDKLPHPLAALTKADAAKLIGGSRDTLERVVKDYSENNRPRRVRNEQMLPLGKLFARAGKGGTVLAFQIYEVLGIDVNKLDGTLVAARVPNMQVIKKKRLRGRAPTGSELKGLTTEQLRRRLVEEVERTRKSEGGRSPWTTLKGIADELTERGHPPQGMLHGQPLGRIDLKRCAMFGTFGSFLVSCRSDDRWLFVLPRAKSRPLDIFAASRLELRYGDIVALTLRQWTFLMSEALDLETERRATSVTAAKLRRAMKSK